MRLNYRSKGCKSKSVAVVVAATIVVTVVQCIECLSLYVAEQLDDMDNNDSVVYYVLLRAVDRFYSQMNRYQPL